MAQSKARRGGQARTKVLLVVSGPKWHEGRLAVPPSLCGPTKAVSDRFLDATAGLPLLAPRPAMPRHGHAICRLSTKHNTCVSFLLTRPNFVSNRACLSSSSQRVRNRGQRNAPSPCLESQAQSRHVVRDLLRPDLKAFLRQSRASILAGSVF